MMRTRGAASVVILAVLIFSAAAVIGQNTNFSFDPTAGSPDQDGRNVLVSGDAQKGPQNVSMNLQIATSVEKIIKGNCGRVVYKDKVRMVDKASGTVASFSTSFTFSFASYDNNASKCGSGMIFMFSAISTVSDVESNLAGGSLCALNFSNPNLRLFAVEFDSDYNPLMSDISDSHIGLDFGANIWKSHNLCGNGTLCTFFCKDPTAKYTAWIDYDSAVQTLDVRFRTGSMSDIGGKPVDPAISYPNIRLDEMLDEEMYVGFIGSTGGQREVHTIWSWKFLSVMPNYSAPAGPSPALIGGICAAVVAGVFVAVLLCFCLIHRRKRPNAFKELPLWSFDADDVSRSYTFNELSSITQNFSASELLSSGGFGDVYKGTLPSGALVAVKRIKDGKEEGEETFLAEVTTLRQTRHRALLQLRGWSQSADGLFLVYDFMCNRSVDKWLHPNPNENDVVNAALTWNVRRLILAGVASGLEYLHEDGVKCVLHRDIKSSNVMLDADFSPYLGDFGLARLVDHQIMQKTTNVAGTFGYMAPEMLHTHKATKETDVYAFGILVLEVVCGRQPLATDAADKVHVLVDSVWRAHEAGNILQVADPRLSESAGMAGGTSEEKVMMANVLHVGLLCCLSDPSERPSMRVVNQWFQSSEVGAIMALPPLPASQPHFSHHYSVPVSSSDGTRLSLTSSLTGR